MTEQKIHFYKGPAGGWGALRSVAKHLQQQGVAVKGAKTLLSANQPDGFDCPGCAWPDRDHRSTFEFCENGAKAIAAQLVAAAEIQLSLPCGKPMSNSGCNGSALDGGTDLQEVVSARGERAQSPGVDVD